MSISTTFPVPSTKSERFFGPKIFSPFFAKSLRKFVAKLMMPQIKMPQTCGFSCYAEKKHVISTYYVILRFL